MYLIGQTINNDCLFSFSFYMDPFVLFVNICNLKTTGQSHNYRRVMCCHTIKLNPLAFTAKLTVFVSVVVMKSCRVVETPNKFKETPKKNSFAELSNILPGYN